VPVVPLVIRGTRRCFHPGGLLLRPGRIEVQVLESLWPPPVHVDGAAALRDAARAAILAALGAEEDT